MSEKSEFDKALGELYDLTEWEDAEAAIRELHARAPEIERLYLDSKILPVYAQAHAGALAHSAGPCGRELQGQVWQVHRREVHGL